MTKRLTYHPYYLEAIELTKAELLTCNRVKLAKSLQFLGHDIDPDHLRRIATGEIKKPRLPNIAPVYAYLFPDSEPVTERTINNASN